MNDAIPLLDNIASRQQVLGIVVHYLGEGAILALLGGPVGHDGHCDLNVRVAHLGVSEDEVTFQLSNATDTDLATLRESVAISSFAVVPFQSTPIGSSALSLTTGTAFTCNLPRARPW